MLCEWTDLAAVHAVVRGETLGALAVVTHRSHRPGKRHLDVGIGKTRARVCVCVCVCEFKTRPDDFFNSLHTRVTRVLHSRCSLHSFDAFHVKMRFALFISRVHHSLSRLERGIKYVDVVTLTLRVLFHM